MSKQETTTIPLKKRKLYRNIIIKSGLMLSVIPRNMGVDDPGNWTERAMRIAILYRACMKLKMSPEKAREFIIKMLQRKRDVYVSDHVIELLIQIGSRPWFVRYWKWLWHSCFEDMSIHMFCMGLCKNDPDKAADKAGVDIFHVHQR